MLQTAHEKAGQKFVSAPVFGRPDAAAAAKLFIAAAGAEADLARVQPLFEAIGQKVFVLSTTPSRANLVKLSGKGLPQRIMPAGVISSPKERFWGTPSPCC